MSETQGKPLVTDARFQAEQIRRAMQVGNGESSVSKFSNAELEQALLEALRERDQWKEQSEHDRKLAERCRRNEEAAIEAKHEAIRQRDEARCTASEWRRRCMEGVRVTWGPACRFAWTWGPACRFAWEDDSPFKRLPEDPQTSA